MKEKRRYISQLTLSGATQKIFKNSNRWSHMHLIAFPKESLKTYNDWQNCLDVDRTD